MPRSFDPRLIAVKESGPLGTNLNVSAFAKLGSGHVFIYVW